MNTGTSQKYSDKYCLLFKSLKSTVIGDNMIIIMECCLTIVQPE
jgi:hypothetical protein